MKSWQVGALALGVALAGIAYDRSDSPVGAAVRSRLGLSADARGAQQAKAGCIPGGVIAGVIRNDGAGWYALDDGDHQPVNIASVETGRFAVTVRFAFRGRVVRTFIAAPDEVLARAGFSVGAGVGLGEATIVFGRAGWTGAHQVSPTLVTTADYPLSNVWLYGLVDGDC